MNIELGILQLANYYEKFEAGASSAYLIINENMKDYKAMFGFAELGEDIEEWKEIFSKIRLRRWDILALSDHLITVLG